ncbi:TetR/AcrR family transcriptional regulator C-terminal domain-containing protein [Isoptericola sp. G70]|uniref:TetR/AcrR family transcriptional regulator n=1 Tax=Isoptericola sp. G70 TaxID=3376633 RepID=UPI003A8094D5
MTDAPELPPRLALAWGVAERPERAPRRELSIERIVAAAVEIADADGLGAVSMARVAKSLGFTTMSLYRHVTSKDDLLLLMQESVIGAEFPPAHEPADWRAELSEWALFTLEIFRQHGWVLDIPVTGAPMTPNNLRATDAGLRALRSTPLADGEKIAALLLVSGYVRNAALLARDLDRAIADAGGDQGATGVAYAEALAELVDEVRFPYLRPLVEHGTYVNQPGGLDEVDDIRWGLDRTLDGLAVLIDARSADAGGHCTGADGVAPPSGTDTGDGDTLTEEAAERARVYAGDPKVKKAATKRKDAERKVREARKRLRELEKAEQAARKVEAEAAHQAADRAARQ